MHMTGAFTACPANALQLKKALEVYKSLQCGVAHHADRTLGSIVAQDEIDISNIETLFADGSGY
jgi:hypothetical protein